MPLEKEDFEVTHGLVMPALYGMRARRYMHDYGLSKEELHKKHQEHFKMKERNSKHNSMVHQALQTKRRKTTRGQLGKKSTKGKGRREPYWMQETNMGLQIPESGATRPDPLREDHFQDHSMRMRRLVATPG